MTPEVEATRPEPNAPVPDERERLIESLSQLISAGRPFSEVLFEAKRLAASPNRAPNPDPIEKLRAGLVARAQQENARRFRMPELTGRTAGLLALTFGAAVLAIAGATLVAILPVSDAIALVPNPIEKPALDPSPKTPAPPSAQPASRAPSSTVAQKSPKTEQVSRLIDGGDAFVRRADLRSARDLYERAVDFGDAQAALRLGASYDPAVLAWAGIRGLPGDPASAIYWYKRARDLGAVSEAEALLKNINSK